VQEVDRDTQLGLMSKQGCWRHPCTDHFVTFHKEMKDRIINVTFKVVSFCTPSKHVDYVEKTVFLLTLK
jgi:hypothetical protein